MVVFLSEMEAINYCGVCEKDTIHLFSGSGTKGTCMSCGHNLPEKQRANFDRVISYNG
jgi:hypothetical protein